MALSNEEKLRNFEAEAMDDAQRICSEIKEKTTHEFQEKLDASEKQLLAELYEFMQNETEKIRKEKSLEISRAGIQNRHEYLKCSDSIMAEIFGKVRERINKFLMSEEYFEYLKESCINVIDKWNMSESSDSQIDIMYMPKDEDIILRLKSELGERFGDKYMSRVNFIDDDEIKTGGLRFHNTADNILINDILDERLERSREMLNESIGFLFREADRANQESNQN